MKIITSAVLACILAGCAIEAPESNRIVQKVQATTLPSGWRVDCVNDHTAALNRCFAGIFGKLDQTGEDRPFQVVFYNGEGPYVEAGWHNDPVNKAIVRVDELQPVRMTNFNQFIPNITAASQRNESKILVNELLKGSVAHVRYYEFGEGSSDMTVQLHGFGEAYGKLLNIIKTKSSDLHPARS